MDRFSLRHYIDIVEGKKSAKAAQPEVAWTTDTTPLFNTALVKHSVIFPDLKEKVKKFIEVKLANPLMNRYGKHDRPFTGILTGFHHCHLRDDAILIYQLKNRKIILVTIVAHAEMEGRKEKLLLNQIAPYR